MHPINNGYWVTDYDIGVLCLLLFLLETKIIKFIINLKLENVPNFSAYNKHSVLKFQRSKCTSCFAVKFGYLLHNSHDLMNVMKFILGVSTKIVHSKCCAILVITLVPFCS